MGHSSIQDARLISWPFRATAKDPLKTPSWLGGCLASPRLRWPSLSRKGKVRGRRDPRSRLTSTSWCKHNGLLGPSTTHTAPVHRWHWVSCTYKSTSPWSLLLMLTCRTIYAPSTPLPGRTFGPFSMSLECQHILTALAPCQRAVFSRPWPGVVISLSCR
jgi:hypothetical protein